MERTKPLSDDEQAYLIWTTFTSEEEKVKVLLRYMVAMIRQKLWDEGVRQIDSNYYHFVLAESLKKLPEVQKRVPMCWFYHGIYCPWLDDILVEDFEMDPKYHQMKSKDPARFEWCDTVKVTNE